MGLGDIEYPQGKMGPGHSPRRFLDKFDVQNG